MAEANRAYEAGEADALRRSLRKYQRGADAVESEGIGAELIRIIRQISRAKERISAIEQELAAIRTSESALLREQIEGSERGRRDLLSELATAIRGQIEVARKQYQAPSR